jgi:hypothetical protein
MIHESMQSTPELSAELAREPFGGLKPWPGMQTARSGIGIGRASLAHEVIPATSGSLT